MVPDRALWDWSRRCRCCNSSATMIAVPRRREKEEERKTAAKERERAAMGERSAMADAWKEYEDRERTTRGATPYGDQQQISPYFNPTYTRTGWIGQPPVLDRHEVVTINGDVDTLRQATP